MSRRSQLAWLAAGAGTVAAASPWVGRARWRWFTAIRAVMPWAGLAMLPMSARAGFAGHRRLAAVTGAVGVATAAMAAPLVMRRSQPDLDPSARPLSVVHANLLYVNRKVGEVPAAIAALDADVVTFSELTPAHARKLRSSAAAERYPYRVERAARGGSGTGLWSRYPLTERDTPATTRHHIATADVAAPGGPVRIVVIHTQSPIVHHRQWEHDFEQLAGLDVEAPALMTGDFNAGWWHPEFRRLLRAGGWRDAHQQRGRGLSCSWPTDQWHLAFRWHPPFVRLDHALVDDGLAVLDVHDFDVPGSDHRGLMVTVQRAARPAP